ncbi:heme-dependent oxidative N-demethylase family protein [Aquisalinus flavus]|uniref:NADH dehydrogenase n=1 Tax=Aquisalinus flavus TaxID=1526572 RepID=A0A8J2V7T4_9PROT|nr:DUF3445 domain-containing protein [Aquisalinus flavus]MBD0425419.1 DUF3445 domain-containing protein [Aquisalinus flavus]UNE48940.1 DUF3445 domain-containing protein [Aquisalinus flavus]GGD16224.1 NADH dehydrogenase [Aquisalinus flavus]
MTAFRHTPYDGSAQPFTMGLAPCAEEDWIEPDAHLTDHLLQKDRLLTDRPDAVYRTTEGMHSAEAALLALLIGHLPRLFPDLYECDGKTITLKPLGVTYSIADHSGAPLTLAGRLVQEDLCLIRPREDGTHELAAACLCFPSSWRLADKIGKPLEAVHGPVPGYESDLAPRVNRLFSRLPDNQILWRMNWSLDENAGDEGEALHRPQPHSHDAWLDAGGDPLDHISIRTERQTVRRLPATGMILFTIKIGLDPLREFAARPNAAALAKRMHDQLAAMTAAQAAYKGVSRARPVILERLADIAAASLR